MQGPGITGERENAQIAEEGGGGKRTDLLYEPVRARDPGEEGVRVAVGEDGQVVEEHEVLPRGSRDEL